MRKLLALLGSLTIAASSAAGVVACGTQSSSTVVKETKFDKDTRYDSLNSVRSLILGNELGLDQKETVTTIKGLDNYPNPKNDNFKSGPKNIVNLNNLNGTIGQKDAPIHSLWNNVINPILQKLSINLDGNKYIDMFSDSIPAIVKYLYENSNNINQLLNLIPLGLDAAGPAIPNIGIDSHIINKIFDILNFIHKEIGEDIDLNTALIEAINLAPQGQKVDMNYIQEVGARALDSLTGFLLNFDRVKWDVSKIDADSWNINDDYPGKDSTDKPISEFLGQQIFTPLFNNKEINSKDIAKMFEDNATYYLEYAHPIFKSLLTFLASLLFQLGNYIPQAEGNDPDYLFSKDKTISNVDFFSKEDSKPITTKDGDIFIDGIKSNISYNNSIFGAIKLLGNDSHDNLGIVKLTNVLFHRVADQTKSYLDKMLYMVIDSLKFTDYHVDVNVEKSVPIIGDLKINLSLDLKDLFGSKQQIDVVSGFSATSGALIIGGNWLPVVGNRKDLKVSLNFSGQGILDAYRKGLAPLLESLLLGEKINSDNLWNMVSGILGDKGGSFFASFSYQKWTGGTFTGHWEGENDPLIDNAWISKTAWGMLGSELADVLNELLETMYYTDGDKFFESLKGLSAAGQRFISDDQIADLKGKIQPYLPLMNEVIAAIKNVKIGSDDKSITIDLTKVATLINLDDFMSSIRILLYKNTIQDSTDKSDALLKQILLTLKDNNKTDEWKKYLGYMPYEDVVANKLDIGSNWVYKDSFVGNIVDTFYPNVTDEFYIRAVKDNLQKDQQAFNLHYLSESPSDVLTFFHQTLFEWYQALQGTDLTSILEPLVDVKNKNIWRISNIKLNKDKDGNLMGEVYDVTFNNSSVSNKDVPAKSGTYRITFSRYNLQDNFVITYIEKIN